MESSTPKNGPVVSHNRKCTDTVASDLSCGLSTRLVSFSVVVGQFDVRWSMAEAPSWEDCFDYAFRFNLINRQQPFCRLTRFSILWNCIQFAILGLWGFRFVMTLLHPGPGFFLAAIFLVTLMSIFIRTGHVSVFAEEYRRYFREVDRFLSECEYDPITKEKNYFLEVWKMERPTKLVAAVLTTGLGTLLLWCVSAVHKVAVSPDFPFPVYWSPYFDSSDAVKWFYHVHEILPGSIFIYTNWYLDMMLTSFTKFHLAQLTYSKKLIAVMAENPKKETRENVIWWIRNHQRILELTDRLKRLLNVHIITAYFSQIIHAVLAIILSISERASQDDAQKVLTPIISLSHLLQFGYDNLTIDKVQDMHESTFDSFYSEKLMGDENWRFSLYKICKARVNKPVFFTGYNFVALNCVTFRQLIVSIYSMYTSLISVLRSKGA